MGRRQHSGLVQKKSLGQVFLNTDWPVQKVVDRLQEWGVRRTIEIGPGPGILTRALLEAGFDVTAVERDDRFVERLADYKRARGDNLKGKLEIVGEDVLKFDLEAWVGSSHEPAAVCGNIPYNISSPILMWALPHLPQLKGINFLTQLEFAARLAGQVGTKAYGSLSVFAQLRAKVTMDCKVDRSCFTPVPKVDSALVSLKPKSIGISDELLKQVETLTRGAFTQRRKILKNAISQFLSEEDLIKNCPIDLNRRPDSLRPEEYVQIAKYIFDNR
ncbi:16S rRNA (adenine(1518)-N(6)/adenine(1519)-N(6))-dimethyltransferase RsmA [Pseudobacteriovorax antillogorgiicola]|uniref:Ribosomal RNA small subunit methyltransferase A n=1 Tax=Pseudobacteriovorax antillogorgiicola TaxID=1513793 RepID=A0A1Y6C6T7_9BACT|nr:16S rRNA (adenine(1518)-N(6)/adenine(1519)-N(6))-dimethyltransferase RsmA [Pseudobacteriovorax antillogorgiicola]TCS49466.1 dimethyladenosine transferase [Pseudobacteriovorax antillogorgiicola]SMF46296.1 dimethyladenosine transferase [Pseudobacteriovorax antillogorgiicola]